MSKPYRIKRGDCLSQLKRLKDNSIESVITYVPKEYTTDTKFLHKVMKECMRVLKPGGHALVGCSEFHHKTALAAEDSGFEIRDVITHLHGE